MQFSSIWSIDRALSGATSPGQSRPWSDSNKAVLCIPQSSSITGTLQSDCLVSYPGQSLVVFTPLQSVLSTTPESTLRGVSYPSEEVPLVYSTAPVHWASVHSSGGGSYPSEEVPLVYFKAPADWAII